MGRHTVVFLAVFASVAALGVAGSGHVGAQAINAASNQIQERDGAADLRRLIFERPPADLDQVAALIPRGNVNAVLGGHVRPVNHMYVQYLVPHDGGTLSVDVNAMAPGEIVMLFHRRSEACVVPDHSVPSDCAPGGTGMIHEYQLFTRHSDELTSNFDHLHSLDARLGLPDWQDDSAGWLRVGSMDILVLGVNGAMAPVRVHPGQRMGATRNYFTTWDIGVTDTRRNGNFLGTGVLRYPTLPEFFAALVASGLIEPLGPIEPFAGEMFVNSACFTDYLTPALAGAWRAKLLGDGSCGRPDWDVAGTLQGNWYRADVVEPTLENMFATEENAISFSPYNLDPANQAKIGFGENFFARVPTGTNPTAVAAARQRLDHGLLFTPDRTPGIRLNPDPLNVHNGDYACFDAPGQLGDPSHPPPNGVVVYLVDVGGVAHLKVRYLPAPCTAILDAYGSNPTLLTGPAWWGDYVR